MSHAQLRRLCTLLLVLSFSFVCLAQEQTAEEKLAASLVGAQTEAERAALLEAKKELVTPKLVQTLIAEAAKLAPQGKFPQALDIYRFTLEIARSIGDHAGMAASFYGAGQIYNLQDDFELAAKNFTESLALRRELGDAGGAGAALNQLGVLQSKQGNYEHALQFYQESLPLLEEAGNKVEISAVMNNIGNAYNGQGMHEQALEYYNKSLKLAEEAKSQGRAAIALTNIGLVHSKQGNYALALESQQKALAIKESQKNRPGIAISLINIGEVYRLQGNYELALEFYEKSLKQFEEIGGKQGIALALNDIGQVHHAQNNFPLAIEFYQKALKQFEEIKDKAGVAETLNNLGLAQRELGRYEAALEFYRRSLAQSEEVNDKPRIAQALSNIADTLLFQNKYRDALQSAERAARVAGEAGSRETLWLARTISGKAYRALGQSEEARQAFSDAIQQVETIRTQLAGGEREQQSFFENKLSPYHEMVELLVGQHRLPEALAYAERAKGRILLDVLQDRGTNINKSMTATEQAQERKLANQLTSLNAEMARARAENKGDAKRLSDLEKRLQEARLNYEGFETDLYVAHPELKLRRGETRIMSVGQAGEMLDARTALLEYIVLEDRTLLFVLNRSRQAGSTELKVFTVEVKRHDLEAKVESFRRALAERKLNFNPSARDLYDLLLAPARAQLQGRENLVIVPDGALWDLPFQALQSSSNQYLLEESAISYAPSLSVLYEIQRLHQKQTAPAKAENATLLAFGNPALGEQTITRAKAVLRGNALEPLPDAEDEVKSLAQLYGGTRSKVYTGAEAREQRAKAESGQFSVLHFATHAILNNASPMYSNLMLSQGDGHEDGLLEAWEIMKLDLKADMVVLSACETARGRVRAGEGMIGLTWALFVAGSPATVVSQWKVDSAGTKRLMLDFHRNLKARSEGSKTRLTKADALRTAALSMLRTSEYRHPFYWASFVLVGDGR